MPERVYALSLKQPWATLVVHGLKSIEIRRWATARRGRILIHAARIPDTRAETTALVPEGLRRISELLGGFIGSAEIVACREYRSADDFTADRALHLNDPLWYLPPVMYGFEFANPKAMPFRPYSGWMRFFPVDGVEA